MASKDNRKLQAKRRRLGWLVENKNPIKVVFEDNKGRQIKEVKRCLEYHKVNGPEDGFYIGTDQIPLRSIMLDNTSLIVTNMDYLNNGGRR